MRWLNSGTLNEGRSLCVTVAIDHSTVDGFHDELQLSAKNTSGKAHRRISWVEEFYLVRWNEYHSISVLDLLKFHQFGSTALPETLSEYVWYAGREVWKGTLMVADLEQVDKIDASEFHNVKLAQREGDDLAQIGDNSKNRRWTSKTVGRRSGSENIHLDRGSEYPQRGEVQEDLGESDRFPPTNKARSHCTSTLSIQRSVISSPKLLRKICGKTCHEFLQQADLRRLFLVKQIAKVVPGLPTSSSSSLLSSTTMTPSRQEFDHPTSSSSSSTSPTMTSSTVSSDIVAR